jgi:hypothetical protein
MLIPLVQPRVEKESHNAGFRIDRGQVGTLSSVAEGAAEGEILEVCFAGVFSAIT